MVKNKFVIALSTAVLFGPLAWAQSDAVDYGGISSEPSGTALTGKAIWFDLVTEDVDEAIEFYRAVFGWSFDELQDDVDVIQNYPAENDCCEHYMRWLKLEIRKRPTFALSHVVIQRTNEFVLLTERQYYIGHTANSIQITLAWLPYEDDTYMGLAVSASADILDSMLGRMLRPIGRNKAKDLVSDVLEEIRTDLESDSND